MSHHHTTREQEHLTKVACLGCLCCRMDRRGVVPANIHHIREGYGLGQRASHFEVLPLCEGHHQGERYPRDASKIAFHKDSETWRRKYGSERELVAFVNETIARLDRDNPGWWEHPSAVMRGSA